MSRSTFDFLAIDTARSPSQPEMTSSQVEYLESSNMCRGSPCKSSGHFA